jgi:hypothetical protein
MIRALFLLLAALAAPAAELRGVWVDRSSLVSRDSICEMMQSLASAHCNAVFVNVWSRGYPLWPSDVFERETGIRVDPSYRDRDVLLELIEEGRAAGDGPGRDARLAGDQGPRDQQGRRPLAGIQQQGGQRQILASGPQHIGRADIARADSPHVARAAQPRQDHPERDRSQQIAAHRQQAERRQRR